MKQCIIPNMDRAYIIDPNILTFRISNERFQAHNLKTSDIIFLEINDKPSRYQMNLYFDGENFKMVPGVKRNLQYLGTIIGKQ